MSQSTPDAPLPLRPEVLVVGGGPAGATTALLLARTDHSVTLIDRARFPRPKACGEFVNPGAVEALRRLGLDSLLDRLPCHRIYGWMLYDTAGPRARGSYGSGRFGLGVPRARFDRLLLEEARAAGVRVHEGVTARSVTRSDTHRTHVHFRCGPTSGVMQPGLVVGADGLRSVVASGLSGTLRPPRLRKVSLSGHIVGTGPDPACGHMMVSDEVTVGLAATDPAGTQWNATVVVDSTRFGRALAADPEAFFLTRLARLGCGWTQSPRLLDGPWASGPFDRPIRCVAGPGFALVGDASGYYDPLTGQGIQRAVRSAELAGPALAAAVDDPARAPLLLAQYAQAVRRDRRDGRWVQMGIESLFARRWTRTRLLSRLGRAPGVVDPVLRVTGNLAPPWSLVRPQAWLPLVLPSFSFSQTPGTVDANG